MYGTEKLLSRESSIRTAGDDEDNRVVHSWDFSVILMILIIFLYFFLSFLAFHCHH